MWIIILKKKAYIIWVRKGLQCVHAVETEERGVERMVYVKEESRN